MWTPTRFPAAMRSLNPTTRAKAIEIANDLLASGHSDKQKVVAVSVDQARTWMRRLSTDTGVMVSAYQLTTM